MKREWYAYHASVLDVLASAPDALIDAVLTDPPYGLGAQPSPEEILSYLGGSELKTGDFMGKDWSVPCVRTWKEIFRVLKPGGYVIAFAGPRTVDLIAMGMRMAGFEIRDVITYAWVYGQGFPKSLNVPLTMDKIARGAPQGGYDPKKRGKGKSPKRIALAMGGGTGKGPSGITSDCEPYEPETDDAKRWAGYGTALKPSFEPIIVARRPPDGTVVENVMKHGTGALNIDGCRLETTDNLNGGTYTKTGRAGTMPGDTRRGSALGMWEPGRRPSRDYVQPTGRWPANFAIDEEAAALLDEQSGESTSRSATDIVRHGRSGGIMGKVGAIRDGRPEGHNDAGGASRFFYVAKATRKERDLGGVDNKHPCVKPISLCRWLARLVLPPPRDDDPRRILVPYAGSGSEMIGAVLAGWDLVEGIEREAEYIPVLRARVGLAATSPKEYESLIDKPKKAQNEREQTSS